MKTRKLTLAPLAGGGLFVAALAGGCTDLEVLSESCASTVVTTDDGKDDYAVRYTVRARNNGMDGRVRAEGRFETASGSYYRDEVTNIASQEEQTFEFIFMEPTLAEVLLTGGELRCRFSYDAVG